MSDATNRVWVVHISNNAEIALRAKHEGFICVGWTAIGDLTSLDTRDKMKAAIRAAFPKWSDAHVRSSYGQAFRFAHEMRIGEKVVYPIKGSRDLMIGDVAGPYRWAADDQELYKGDYCNVRKVTWIKTVPRITFSRPALHSFGSFSSVSSSDEFLDEVKAAIKGDAGSAKKSTADQQLDPTEDEAPTAEGVNQADQTIQETEDYLLEQWSRTGQDFEEVVASVFRAMGYTAITQRGTHDLGADVIAHPDPLGVQPPRLKIQAKSGTGSVGAPAVKQLRGICNEGEKAILISLGSFSNDALHVQQNDANVVLIDGGRFVKLFLDYYEQLEPEMRHRFPLRRVYVPSD